MTIANKDALCGSSWPAAGSNLRRMLDAKPGEVIQIIPPFPGYDTGWLLMLDKCPTCDRPHCVEVTDRPLTDDERLRVWIYIHRQRKEWDAKEKEMVAYRLVDLVDRAAAANILDISVRELDKLVQVFGCRRNLPVCAILAGGITSARELNGLSRNLVTPSVVDAVVRKVSQRRITNSKDVRKLRTILPDPIAREYFLSKEGDVDSAMLRIGPAAKKKSGLASELDAAIEAMKQVPWTELTNLKGDPETLQKITDAEALLKSLRKALGA